MNVRNLAILLLLGRGISTAQKCSPFCICDMTWEGLRRTVCTHKNLAGIVTNVPERVQVLDLSFNYIKSIDDDSFHGQLTSLMHLNLSRNHIQHIGMKAFNGLKQLKLLDLSYNHIKYLLDGIFLETPQLETLVISGNDFSRIISGPFTEASSLKVLYMSQCRIEILKPDTFSKTPNVVGLDLSGNYLAQLDITTLSKLQSLEKVDLSRNRWHCDNETTKLTIWLTERNINYTPICLEEETSMEEGEFAIEPSDNEIEMAPGSKYWPDEDKKEDMNGKIKYQNKVDLTYEGLLQEKFKYFFYITHLFDAIPSFWAFAIGFQVGTVLAIFGTLIMVHTSKQKILRRPRPPVHHRWSLRRSVRLRSTGSNDNPWTELQSIDCPDTPPPPYKDINVALNNVRTYT